VSKTRLIDLGTGIDGKRILVDLDVLMRSNLLVQANTGGGKSYLLRRLVEQAFGLVPIIIIDPEGEFATLREKFGFVLVGPGGETVPDIRSAGLLAHRLVKIGASAVCDLSEMKPGDRHLWVKAFLEAMVEAPKDLWVDTMVVVDEAHVYMPEVRKKERPSPASDAMVDLAARGQKRGRCSIYATQRLAKLGKDGAAELQNVLVGPTFLDVDLDRACDALSVPTRDRRELMAQLKVLEPGNFFALGRALSKERLLVQVGPVETTHPERGRKRRTSRPPPAPDKIKHLLPQLADLPKEAEEKAATEAMLRERIAELMRELRAAKTNGTVKVERVTAPRAEVKLVLDKAAVARLERAVEKLDKMRDATAQAQQTVVSTVGLLSTLLRQAMDTAALRPGGTMVKAPPAPVRTGRWPADEPNVSNRLKTAGGGNGVSAGDMPEAARRVLTALAQFPDAITRRKAGILAGYAPSGSSMRAALAYCRKNVYVLDHPGDILSATPTGMTALGSWTPLPTGRALLDHWLGTLPEAARVLLKVFADNPTVLTQHDLEVLTEKRYLAGGSSMRAGLARLRGLDLVVDNSVGTTISPELVT